MPGAEELQHAHLTPDKLITHQTNHPLAVLYRPLDTLSNYPSQRKVPGMVADPVPDPARVAVLQAVHDPLGNQVVRTGAADERVEGHIFVVTLVDVERMKIELYEDVDATAID